MFIINTNLKLLRNLLKYWGFKTTNNEISKSYSICLISNSFLKDMLYIINISFCVL